MPQTEVEIVNKLGLHARASAKLTQTASRFGSEVWIARNGRRVNAKNIMGVMMLAAAKGAKVSIDAQVNPDILGGLVVKVGSRLFDSSIRSKLARLQLAMKGVA